MFEQMFEAGSAFRKYSFYMAFIILIITVIWFYTAGGQAANRCQMVEPLLNSYQTCVANNGLPVCMDKEMFLNYNATCKNCFVNMTR